MTPQQTIGHYRITSKLGQGGMGAVYRALDTKLNREVAIKVLPEALLDDPDYMARFTREAQVLAALNHPNIAAVYGVEERAIVMELVEGSEPRGPLPLETALDYARQITEALEAAHEKGIVHRDLKPANIKVTADGKVKVLDFGLATAPAPATATTADSPTLTLRATQAGVILGTAAYMAPEQAAGKAVDKRADIWAFGVLLYELLTGQPLFSGETISHILASVLKDPISLESVPAAVRPLLMRCLDRDPRTRLRDIGEARIILSQPLPVAVKPAASSTSRWWIAGCILLLIALAGLSMFVLRAGAPPPATRFQIFPPSPTFAFTYGGVAPDGRKLVYQSTGPGFGRPVIWVRSFDSLDARPLPGTEGAIFPFWSPDSRSIGFAMNGKLFRTDASGGPIQLICDTSSLVTMGGNVAGAWSSDGNIYFSAAGKGIFRISQTGGEYTNLAKPDRSHGEGSFFFPVPLPDRRGLLFHNQRLNRDSFGIDFTSLDGKRRAHVVPSQYSFGYAPPLRRGEPAHILLVRQDTLVAQPVDPAAFVPAGEPFTVAERVGAFGNTARVSVSPAGVLAYRPLDAPAVRELTWFDRTGNRLSSIAAPGDWQHVALSRDGSSIAAVQGDGRNRRDIWLVQAARGAAMRFTFELPENDLPLWSADGSQIVFSSRSNGPFKLKLKASQGAGGEEAMQEPVEFGCDWSDDGRFLLASRRMASGLQLWYVTDPRDPAKRKSQPYIEGQHSAVRGKFAPAAGGPPHWVAYESDESGRGAEIYVQSFPAGSGKFLVSKNGGTQPRWRRDGRELFYLSPEGKLMAVDVQVSKGFQAGVPHELFDPHAVDPLPNSTENYYRYDVTGDGKRFLFTTPRAAGSDGPPPSIVVVVNWLSGVKK